MKIHNIITSVAFLIAIAPALAGEIEKGVPEAPPNAKAVVGTYGFTLLHTSMVITLKDNGHYFADESGCMGKLGKVSGTWKLSDKTITLSPEKGTDYLMDNFRTLEVLKYKGNWIFLDPGYRVTYENVGVSACFQDVYRKHYAPAQPQGK
jgi:hypothetical protein